MKKTRKKGIRSLAILLVLVLTLGFSPVTNVEAKAAPRLNYKKVTLVQGKKKRLKVRNLRRRRKVKWYSTKKSVATVNRKGIVKAKKKGKTFIVAKVGKKKYRCKVIVKKKVSKKKKKTKKSNKKTNKKAKINKSTKKQLPAGKYATRIIGYYGVPTFKVGKTENMFNYLENSPKNISANVKAKYYKWYSSNTSILKINKYGTATPKKAGTVKVSCRYRNRFGEWFTTEAVKIKVIDAGDVTFSYTLNFDKEKHLQKFPNFTGFNDSKHHYNFITLTVRNNSDSTVELNKQIEVSAIAMIHYGFVTVDRKPVQIPAHTTRTINYYIDSEYNDIYEEFISNYVVLDKESTDRVWIYYKKDGKTYYPCHYLNSNKWIY